MSTEVDTDEEITVNVDGVRVSKAFEAEEFPVPAIRFHIASERDDAVTIRLSESIPDDFPMDGVGFHPDYESDNWTAFQDHHVEYQRTLEPGEEITTVYGIRIDGPDEVPKFLTEPELPTVRPEGETVSERDEEELDDTTIDDIASSDSNQVVKDMLSGESEGVPGLSDEEDPDESDVSFGGPDDGDDGPEIELDLGDSTDDPAADDDGPEIELDLDADDDADDVDPAAAPEPTDESDTATDAGEPDAAPVSDDAPDEATTEDVTTDETDADESGDDAPAEETAAGAATSGVAAALATELREGRVDEADKAVLREALDLEPDDDDGEEDASEAPSVPTTVETRIETLQTSVADLEAYTDSLEEFLNEEGTGEQLIEGFKEEVASVREEMEDLRAEVAANDDAVEAVEGDVEALSEDVSAVADRVDETGEAVAAVEDEVAGVESDLSETRASVEELDAQLDDAVADVREDVEAVESEVSAVADDVEDAREELGEEIDDVEDDLEDELEAVRAELSADVESVRDDLAAIEEWREQLGEMFAGPAVGGTGDDTGEDDDPTEDDA